VNFLALLEQDILLTVSGTKWCCLWSSYHLDLLWRPHP